MVEIAVARIRNLQCAEADVVERLVVDAVRLVCVLHQLMDGQSGVVRLHHRIGHLWRWHHRIGVHYAIRILFANLRYEQGAHARASAAAQRMRQLKALKIRWEYVSTICIW